MNVVGDKVLNLVVFSSAFYLMGLAAGRSIHVMNALRMAVIGLSFITVLAMALAASKAPANLIGLALQNNAFKVFTESYQATTLCIGVAATFALVKTLTSQRGYRAAAWTAMWAIFSLSTLAGGGKGAALGCVLAQAAILGVALIVRQKGQDKRRAMAILALLPISAVIAFFVALQLHLQTVERFMRFASTTADATGRLRLWHLAVDMAERHPFFGAGFGSYEASANAVEDAGMYPHNLFLESLAETGLMGFVLFSSALIAAIICVFRRIDRLEFASVATWLGMFLITMVEINVSGTVTDRFLTFSLGMSAGLIARADSSREMASHSNAVTIGQPTL
jgi:O-antigen ligase